MAAEHENIELGGVHAASVSTYRAGERRSITVFVTCQQLY